MSCNCERCIAAGMLDVCSSECTEECSARDHCNLVNDPYCTCKSCAAHNLDELPPKEIE